MTVKSFAPAKVNLALHVVGRREDGFHLLDMLVAFGPVADKVTADDAQENALIVTGPHAKDVPTGQDNLVVRAASLVAPDRAVSIGLEKHLPVMSGIGGGSSDAAAALRAVAALAGSSLPDRFEEWSSGGLSDMAKAVLALGADVPMCLLAQACRARGTGENLTPVSLPDVPVVLVNPRVPVGTPQVFREFGGAFGAGLPDALPAFKDADALINWLAEQRNDLQAPACRLAPVISDVLDLLHRDPNCRLARMSGSGATCFGLYDTVSQARDAAAAIKADHPDWWVTAGYLGNRADWTAARKVTA